MVLNRLSRPRPARAAGVAAAETTRDAGAAGLSHEMSCTSWVSASMREVRIFSRSPELVCIAKRRTGAAVPERFHFQPRPDRDGQCGSNDRGSPARDREALRGRGCLGSPCAMRTPRAQMRRERERTACHYGGHPHLLVTAAAAEGFPLPSTPTRGSARPAPRLHVAAAPAVRRPPLPPPLQGSRSTATASAKSHLTTPSPAGRESAARAAGPTPGSIASLRDIRGNQAVWDSGAVGLVYLPAAAQSPPPPHTAPHPRLPEDPHHRAPAPAPGAELQPVDATLPPQSCCRADTRHALPTTDQCTGSERNASTSAAAAPRHLQNPPAYPDPHTSIRDIPATSSYDAFSVNRSRKA